MSSVTIGIDLGGTQIKGVVATWTGEVLRREVRTANDDAVYERTWSFIARNLAEHLGHDLAVGIAAPGLAARDRRSIAILPKRLRGIEGLDWTTFLNREHVVPVSNDAHAALAGEAWIGAARGMQNAIMLTLGTGVGGAILADGKILRGHIGRAGHFGHTCLDVHGEPSIVGTPGALEDVIGNHNILARTDGRFATTHELVAAYRAYDDEARRFWLTSIHALACAIASFVNILDPEAVIIGGGIAQAGDALFTPLAEELAKIEWRPNERPVKIIPAALGEWAGAIGAARNAMP